MSEVMGPSWAEIRMPCVGWTVRPKWKYEGKLCASPFFDLQPLTCV